MEKVIALSHELNCGIHMHLSETKGEVENVIKATDKTPIAHMHDLGLFWNTTLASSLRTCNRRRYGYYG